MREQPPLTPKRSNRPPPQRGDAPRREPALGRCGRRAEPPRRRRRGGEERTTRRREDRGEAPLGSAWVAWRRARWEARELGGEEGAVGGGDGGQSSQMPSLALIVGGRPPRSSRGTHLGPAGGCASWPCPRRGGEERRFRLGPGRVALEFGPREAINKWSNFIPRVEDPPTAPTNPHGVRTRPPLSRGCRGGRARGGGGGRDDGTATRWW